jgi:peptidoglycan/LPS O-acetylase OafA/YrhL
MAELTHAAETTRSNNFDALRLMAALLVIWGHQFPILGLPTPLITHNEPGALGVVMFFAISGYLVTQSWRADPHLGRFALRRALRIWPGLTVAVLLCVVVLGPLVTTLPLREYFTSSGTLLYLRNLWLNMRFALPGVFESNPIVQSVNGPLWTIPLEVGCYVALGLAGVLGAVRTRWVAPVVLVGMMSALQWRYSVPAGAAVPEWSFGLQYGMVFALGSTLAVWADLWRGRILAATSLWTVSCYALHIWGPQPLASQAIILSLGGLAVLLGQASWPLLRSAGRWGDVSYGLYIYAFPIQQLLVTLGAQHWGFNPALAATLAASFTLAALSWHWVEKPALNFKPQRPTASGGSKLTQAAAG